MKNIHIITSLVIVVQFFAFYSASANMSMVLPRVNRIQEIDPTLPSGVVEQKGIFGTIIANLFDANARIKPEFLTNLIPTVTPNNIPKWNGTAFVNSLITDNGNVSVNSDFYVKGSRLQSNNVDALGLFSNNLGVSQLNLRNSAGTQLVSLYGDSSGTGGILDGDGDWSYLAKKDVSTEFRINNSTVMQFDTNNLYSSAQQQVIGWGRTGNRYAYTDYVGDDTYTDYGLRIIRMNGGANTSSEIDHRGTGDFIINAQDAGNLKFATNGITRVTVAPTTGNVGIGNAPTTDKLSVTGNITATGDMKANIMYDGNDTNYYVDPNGTSNVWYLNRQRAYGVVEYDVNDTNYFVDPTGTSAYNDLRANVFYDRQDTGYYLDPNATSRLNDIRPNIMYDGQDAAYYVDPNGSSKLNMLKILQGITRDVRIEGLDQNGTGRNLALLGDRVNDRLIVNYGGEYAGGVVVSSNLNVTGYIKTTCIGNCF